MKRDVGAGEKKISEYYHDKLMMANKIKMEEDDGICYMIEGMNNPSLQSVLHLLDVMNEITTAERYKRAMTTVRSNSDLTSSGIPVSRTPYGTTRIARTTNDV